jgi:hypothetical protein
VRGERGKWGCGRRFPEKKEEEVGDDADTRAQVARERGRAAGWVSPGLLLGCPSRVTQFALFLFFVLILFLFSVFCFKL